MAKKTVGKEMRFLNALMSGKVISRRQARANYRLGNPSATALRIEEAGFKLNRFYSKTKIRVNGKPFFTRTVKYSIDVE